MGVLPNMDKGVSMTRLTTILTGVFLAASLSGCLPKATDQEIEQMCENLVKLRGGADLTPLEERIARIDKELEARKGDIEKRYETEAEALARNLEGRLAELGEDATEEEQAAIEESDAERKAEAARNRDEALEHLGSDREQRVAEAGKRLEQGRSKAAAGIRECADEARAVGVTQKLAQCRIEATSTDQYWNLCR